MPANKTVRIRLTDTRKLSSIYETLYVCQHFILQRSIEVQLSDDKFSKKIKQGLLEFRRQLQSKNWPGHFIFVHPTVHALVIGISFPHPLRSPFLQKFSSKETILFDPVSRR